MTRRQVHDCASLDVDGESIMLKSDYYDDEHGVRLARPRRPQHHAAVLTVMLRKILVRSTGTPAPHLPRGPEGRVPPSPSSTRNALQVTKCECKNAVSSFLDLAEVIDE